MHDMVQEQEYRVLSDLPGAVEGLGHEHALSPSMRQHWEQCRLSNSCVGPNVVEDTLVFWRDATSPYSLVRFGDLAERGAPQVGPLACAGSHACGQGMARIRITCKEQHHRKERKRCWAP